ncbi:MAG: periplasmic heavy metal sensor [Acidobacteria bacterium]|nr:periplasmic heavy metal sensor [Acidobacteriota bacterium]
MRMMTFALAASMTMAPAALAGDGERCAKHGSQPAGIGVASPYAGEQERALKSLSDDEIKAFRSGAGMGLAKPAELNHYPGPKHAIELAGDLRLSEEQLAAARRAFDAMNEEATTIGQQIVVKEESLDRLFASGHANDDAVVAATLELGALHGRLRAAHLKAHIRMREIMTAEQIAAYDTLRGYTP